MVNLIVIVGVSFAGSRSPMVKPRICVGTAFLDAVWSVARKIAPFG